MKKHKDMHHITKNRTKQLKKCNHRLRYIVITKEPFSMFLTNLVPKQNSNVYTESTTTFSKNRFHLVHQLLNVNTRGADQKKTNLNVLCLLLVGCLQYLPSYSHSLSIKIYLD